MEREEGVMRYENFTYRWVRSVVDSSDRSRARRRSSAGAGAGTSGIVRRNSRGSSNSRSTRRRRSTPDSAQRSILLATNSIGALDLPLDFDLSLGLVPRNGLDNTSVVLLAVLALGEVGVVAW